MESRRQAAADLPVIRFAKGKQAVDARGKARAWCIEMLIHSLSQDNRLAVSAVLLLYNLMTISMYACSSC